MLQNLSAIVMIFWSSFSSVLIQIWISDQLHADISGYKNYGAYVCGESPALYKEGQSPGDCAAECDLDPHCTGLYPKIRS